MWWRPWHRRWWYWRRPVYYGGPFCLGPMLLIGMLFVLMFVCLFGLSLLRFVAR